MPGRSCLRTCTVWWAPLVLERGGDRFGLAQPRGACVAGSRAGHRVRSLGNALHKTAYGGSAWRCRTPGSSVRGGWRLVRAFHEYRDFAHLQVLVRWVYRVERRVQLGHSPRVCGPRLVQGRGCVPGAARPEGLQQGWGAAAEGHGRPRARQLHGQGPA